MEEKWLWVLQYWFVFPILVPMETYQDLKKDGVILTSKRHYWWFKSVAVWFWQFWWPLVLLVMILVATGGIHHLLEPSLSLNKSSCLTCKYSSALFQAIGSLGTVISIVGNLNLFEKEGFLPAVVRWLRFRPLLKSKGSFSTPKLKQSVEVSSSSVELTAETNELQAELLKLRRHVDDEIKRLETRLTKIEKATTIEIEEIKSSFRNWLNRFERSVLKDLKFLIFSLLLTITGIIIGVIH